MNNLNYSHLDATIDFKFKNAVKNHKSGNFLSAQEDCEFILENSPDNFEVINLLGTIYLKQQKYDECKTDEEKAELIRPKTTHRDAMGFVNNLPPAMIYDRFRQFVTRKNSEVAMPGMMKYFPKKP